MNAQKYNDKYNKKNATDIDMTPMTDLAFLLLTFFMLTTTFNNPQAMELVMPLKPDEADQEEQIQAVKESKAMSIVLSSDDRIFWYMGLTDPEVNETHFNINGNDDNGVRGVLLEQNQLINDLVVLIKPDVDSRYKNLVDILDEMNVNGIRRYAIVDIHKEDQELIAPNKQSGSVDGESTAFNN